MDPNSMLNWYPRIKDLEIPQPRTVMIDVRDVLQTYDEGDAEAIMDLVDKSKGEIRKLGGGYPLFLRTDKLSGKHDWSRTCFVKTEKDLQSNIVGLIEASYNCDIIGRPVEALVFREYIKMDSAFRAFGGLPISRERRYFVECGKVICHHPYWPEGAIEFYKWMQVEEPFAWKEALKLLNTESKTEIGLLSTYASQVSNVLEGYWSVDFCRAANRIWYLIDCALGGDSWHPECEKTRQITLF